MEHIEAPFGFPTWGIIGINVLFVEENIKFGTITGNQPVGTMIGFRLKMGVELFKQMQEGFRLQLAALLMKSRNRGGIGTETEVLK